MKKALTLLGFAVVLTLVFSIRIGRRTVFGHIYSVLSPVTTAVQDEAEGLFARSYRSTSAYTRKLFDNSVPKMKDTVKTGLSSVKKGGEPEEDISVNEKEELDELIKTHR